MRSDGLEDDAARIRWSWVQGSKMSLILTTVGPLWRHRFPLGPPSARPSKVRWLTAPKRATAVAA